MVDANPINVTQIDHVVIRANDIDALIRFYQSVIGCKLERGPGDLGLAQLRAGTSLIDIVDVAGPLGKQGGATPNHQAPNMDHFCLLVQPWDTEVIESHLRKHGVEFSPAAQRYGATGMGLSIYLVDPEGNNVELKSATT